MAGLTKNILYPCADALGIDLGISVTGRVSGAGEHVINIAGVRIPFSLGVMTGEGNKNKAALIAVGPGDLYFVVFSEQQGLKTTTTVFICGKSQSRPVPALPQKTQSITYKNLKALYGPSAVLIVQRDNNPLTEWTELKD